MDQAPRRKVVDGAFDVVVALIASVRRRPQETPFPLSLSRSAVARRSRDRCRPPPAGMQLGLTMFSHSCMRPSVRVAKPNRNSQLGLITISTSCSQRLFEGVLGPFSRPVTRTLHSYRPFGGNQGESSTSRASAPGRPRKPCGPAPCGTWHRERLKSTPRTRPPLERPPRDPVLPARLRDQAPNEQQSRLEPRAPPSNSDTSQDRSDLGCIR